MNRRDRIAAQLIAAETPDWARPYEGFRKSENVEDWRAPTSSPFDYAFRSLPSMLVREPLPPSTPLARDLGENELVGEEALRRIRQR